MRIEAPGINPIQATLICAATEFHGLKEGVKAITLGSCMIRGPVRSPLVDLSAEEHRMLEALLHDAFDGNPA